MAGKKKPQRKRTAKPPPRRLPTRPQIATARAGSGLAWTPIRAEQEPLSDVAICSVQVRNALDPAERAGADAVVQALEDIARGDDAAAVQRLAAIPRSSPYAQWRWFVRGLVAFEAGDRQAADANWSKLDAARRPYRIAAALRLADGAAEPAIVENRSIQAAAQRLQELRSVRPALAAARQIIASAKRQRRSDPPEKRFAPDDVSRLMAFRDEYRQVEPRFVRAFELACVRTCFFQPYSDVFRLITSRVTGPTHDPRWNLLQSMYHSEFQDGRQESLKYLKLYQSDVAKQSGFCRDVGNALISLNWLQQAFERGERSMPSFLYGSVGNRNNDKETEAAFQQAVAAYPANREAHRARIAYLTEQAESPRLRAKARKEIEERIIQARRDWVKGLPDEIEQQIMLIDHFLEEDDLTSADAHLQAISGRRSDNPLVAALPWKLKLRQAMRLSKQKRNLPAATAALDEAAALWPPWLPQDWLPFLQAALAMRGGDAEKCEQLLEAISSSERYPAVTFDALWFGAAQQMNLPAAFISSLREAVEDDAKAAERLSLDDLISLGSAYWDLDRAGIMYRGYRGHGSKFGKAFAKRLKQKSSARRNRRFINACFWATARNYWQIDGSGKVPAAIANWTPAEPLADALVLRAMLQDRYFKHFIHQHAALIQRVRESVTSQTDPFDRHFLQSLAEQAEQIQHEASRRFSGFRRWMEEDDEDDFEDDFDVDLEDDDDDWCDCPECRATRGESSPFAVDDLDPPVIDEAQWRAAVELAPPALQVILSKVPQEMLPEFASLMLQMAQSQNFSPERLVELFVRAGIDPIELLNLTGEVDEDDFDPAEGLEMPEFSAEPPMSAAQRQAMRKKRKPPTRSKRKR